jgi:hypothetical protein
MEEKKLTKQEKLDRDKDKGEMRKKYQHNRKEKRKEGR